MSASEPEAEIGGFFRSNLLAMRNAISQQDFKKFANLELDGQRVAFILSYPEAYRLSLEVEKPMTKDGDAAAGLKNVGNKFFGRGEFAKALETYSNAALLAPSTGKDRVVAKTDGTVSFLYYWLRNANATLPFDCYYYYYLSHFHDGTFKKKKYNHLYLNETE